MTSARSATGVLGADHPDTLVSRREVAVGLGWLGRWDEALTDYRRVADAREQVLGAGHPDTLASRNDEAHCLEQLGRGTEAAELYRGWPCCGSRRRPQSAGTESRCGRERPRPRGRGAAAARALTPPAAWRAPLADVDHPVLPRAMPAHEGYDAVIVGGGHNGLVAAAYLARAGRSVLVLERLATTGGAAVSTRPFAGVDARLSRYSYLVSLLPRKIVDDLGLDFARPRPHGVLVHPVRAGRAGHRSARRRRRGAAPGSAFARLTGSDREFEAWQRFYALTAAGRASSVFPTLTEPLPTRDELRAPRRRPGRLADAVRGTRSARRSRSTSRTTSCAESSSPTR